jgi:TfoX/Sxy family transcriptional regulator of competence genes
MGMSWEKSPARLIQLFEELAPREPSVEKRQMFGWPCCFYEGNLFMGLHKDSMIFRLPEAERQEFLRQPGAAEFSPMPGRPMKEYVAARTPLLEDHQALTRWVAHSLAYARQLPSKAKAKSSRIAGSKGSARTGRSRAAGKPDPTKTSRDAKSARGGRSSSRKPR